MKSILNPKNYKECLERINLISEEHSGLWGTMSANQMLCHCADQIRMAYGEIKVPDNSKFISRLLLKHLILLGMPTPKGKIDTAKEIKQGELGSKCIGVDEDKEKLIQQLDHLINKADRKVNIAHPEFGKLNYEQWARLVYLHLDHHLKQFAV